MISSLFITTVIPDPIHWAPINQFLLKIECIKLLSLCPKILVERFLTLLETRNMQSLIVICLRRLQHPFIHTKIVQTFFSIMFAQQCWSHNYYSMLINISGLEAAAIRWWYHSFQSVAIWYYLDVWRMILKRDLGISRNLLLSTTVESRPANFVNIQSSWYC